MFHHYKHIEENEYRVWGVVDGVQSISSERGACTIYHWFGFLLWNWLWRSKPIP